MKSCCILGLWALPMLREEIKTSLAVRLDTGKWSKAAICIYHLQFETSPSHLLFAQPMATAKGLQKWTISSLSPQLARMTGYLNDSEILQQTKNWTWHYLNCVNLCTPTVVYQWRHLLGEGWNASGLMLPSQFWYILKLHLQRNACIYDYLIYQHSM